MSETLNAQNIETILPHRYENFLVDSCTVSNNNFELLLDIGQKDPLSRDIFLIEQEDYQKLNNCILAEVMALASIIAHGSDDPSQTAIFASISNFKIKEAFKSAHLSATVQHQNSKQGFFRYCGEIKSQTGEGAATAQLMAYASKDDEVIENDQKKHHVNVPRHSQMTLPIPYKSMHLNCINSVEHYSKNSLLSAYVYPLAHPCVKGHFPHKPIMMGVMQWMMAEDALYHWVQLHADLFKQQQHSIYCDAIIINQNDEVICELSKLVFSFEKGSTHSFYINCQEAKRIFFRSIVEPGTLLFCDLKISKIDDHVIENQ